MSTAKKQPKSYLVTLHFEIEVEGRGPYSEIIETDLSELDGRYYIEDLDEDENPTEGT